MNQDADKALSVFAEQLCAAIKHAAPIPFNDWALALFRLQLAHNPAMARVCAAQHPDAVSHWTTLPAVPAVAFKELEMTSLASQERTHIFHSSGTTGQRPSRHFHHAQSLALYEASLTAWHAHTFDWNAACPRMLFLTPPPDQAPHSSLVHMLDTLGRRAPDTASPFVGCTQADGSWGLDIFSSIELLERSVSTAEPLALLGTAFNFVQLLDALTETGRRFRLPQGSRVMETGGYKGRTRSMPRAELHAWIGTRLGIPSHHVVCEYGMSELSSQAYDHALTPPAESAAPSPRPFRFPPWARALIVSPETGLPVHVGETGLIRIIDLANVWSTLVIQTEDMGLRLPDGFELLGRVTRSEPRGCSLQSS